MRKASATVIYNSKTMKILNITFYVIKTGANINFTPKSATKKRYGSWIEMQKEVQAIAKNNGFYFKRWYEFDGSFSDINMIDIKTPERIDRYLV